MAKNGSESTTMISAFVPVVLRDELRRLADVHDRSVSAEVRTAIRRHVVVSDPDLPLGPTGSSSEGAPAAMTGAPPFDGEAA